MCQTRKRHKVDIFQQLAILYFVKLKEFREETLQVIVKFLPEQKNPALLHKTNAGS